MATDTELAVLSYRSYVPSARNDVLTASWDEDENLSLNGSSGFAARVYTKSSEVVISFRGTDDPAWQDFWNGNIPAARGTYSEQVAQAIELVSDVMAAHPGATIVLAPLIL